MKKVSTGFIKSIHYHFLISAIVFGLITIVSCGGGGGDGVDTPINPPKTGPSWTHPTDLDDSISPDGLDAGGPKVAMDSNGNAIITWSQEDFDGNGVYAVKIYKSEYRNGAWAHPSGTSDNISPDPDEDFQDAGGPRVAMDSNGNAIITWSHWGQLLSIPDPLPSKILKSEYRNGAWTHPSDLNDNINPDVLGVGDPQVAMDSNGDAIITWSQHDETDRYQIFKSEYRDGAWIHPSGLSDNISPDGLGVDAPQVAMDSNGNAIITWRQRDATDRYQIYKSEYRNSAWTHPSGLGDNISPDGLGVDAPQVAMGSNGDAIITWRQEDGSRTAQIFKSEYRDGVWSHPSGLGDNISLDGVYAEEHHTAMDSNGNAIIAWTGETDRYQIFKSEYRNGAWIHPNDLNDNINPDWQDAYSPQVAMDSNGNAIITWVESDGNSWKIFKSEYRNGAWTHPNDLNDNINPDGMYAYNPQVAMDSNGDAIITWSQANDTGFNQIFKSEYR